MKLEKALRVKLNSLFTLPSAGFISIPVAMKRYFNFPFFVVMIVSILLELNQEKVDGCR